MILMENQNFLQQRAMWLKASDLHEFYDSPLGMAAQRMISEHVREIWPDVSGMELLVVGFPTPLLKMHFEAKQPAF